MRSNATKAYGGLPPQPRSWLVIPNENCYLELLYVTYDKYLGSVVVMFEHVDMPMISRIAFVWRLFRQLGLTILVGCVSLAVGMCGYHYFEGMDWLDAFVNASMLLGGMGPVSALHTDAGKLFAGMYALYCGVFMVVCGGLLLVPVFHRVLHHFHADAEDE